MNLLPIVQQLEGKSGYERFEIIKHQLDDWHLAYTVQTYATGKNLVVPSTLDRWIGIGSHFDVVPHSPGANDNASAIVVCLAILQQSLTYPLRQTGISVFFFDEEEKGMKGSKAYIAANGLQGMMDLINLEMVGMGEQYSLMVAK
jgi:Zn-dependent M28 family amino/carboxypeptidase